MSDKANPARASRDQLRRQFVEQATAAFDRMFAVTDSGQPETSAQREQRAREFAQQLTALLLQQETKSEAGFLQDIFAHPEDDTPRLIYADWLEDNHQPARAQFIRVQCRLAKLDPEDPDHDLLSLQEQELLKDHGPVWMGHLPVWARKGATFQRGFVNRFVLTPRQLYRHGKKLRQQVYFDSVHWDPLYHADEALDQGMLAGIRHLAVTGSEDELLLLVRSKQITGLESLEFCGPVSEEVCRALASNRHLGRLRRLTFRGARLEPAHAAILSQSPLLGHLEELAVLFNTQLKTEGIQLLGQSPHWGQLKRLSFNHSNMGPEAVRELVRSPVVKGVTSLSLVSSYVHDAVRDLAQAPYLKDLAYLNLHNNQFGDKELEVLGKSNKLPQLTSLNVYFNSITVDGIRPFSKGRLLQKLQRLILGGWGGGCGEVKALVQSPGCQQLRHLTLGYYQVGSEDVAALTGSPYLSRLTSLSLENNSVDANGARTLAAATNLPALHYLNLSSNKIGSEGAEALATSPLGKQLERLNLKGAGVPLVVREQLEARFGRRFSY